MPKNLLLNLIDSKNNKISLSDNRQLDIASIFKVAINDAQVSFKISKKHNQKIETIFNKMVEQIKDGTPIYGATTAYGAQASRVVTKGKAKERYDNASKLSEAIVHVDVSTGPIIPKEVTRAAILIRINMLLSGHSAIRLEVLEQLKELLNEDIIPLVGQYGTVGASGDLALNGRVLSVLKQSEYAKVWDKKGKVKSAKSVLKKANFKQLKLEPKEGLAMVNGDNFSTAAAGLICRELSSLMLLNTAISSMVIQNLRGSVRNFHPLLAKLRPHEGQKFTAQLLRTFLKDSKLARQDLKGHLPREEGVNVQDPYSIRCLPQFFGPDWETLNTAWKTIEINANGVSDNPLWTSPDDVYKGEDPYHWVSGGNFLAMHMSDTLDKMRKVATHIVKQNDRHLSRLIHPKLNKNLSANLSDPKAISQCTFKGLQTQMGMYEVFATVMAAPVSTAFGIHEELNQDLTSHAFTSAIMTWRVMELVRFSMATNLIASCQAIDLQGGPDLLSPATKPLYEFTRKIVPFIVKEQPLGHFVEMVAEQLKSNQSLLEHFVKLSQITDGQ